MEIVRSLLNYRHCFISSDRSSDNPRVRLIELSDLFFLATLFLLNAMTCNNAILSTWTGYLKLHLTMLKNNP